MNIRNYNIYFHTHTISGIIITAVLYVIFFAGSFSFFKKEVSNWQHNTTDYNTEGTVNFSKVLDSLDSSIGLYGRDISFYKNEGTSNISVYASQSKDTTVPKASETVYFSFDPKTNKNHGYRDSYDLGEFLYRLHFLAQLNVLRSSGIPLGYYIAGGVAFIFLFALITGLLVHWDKIISNFYIFRPREKLKTVWTDLHTALGVISFPFLFVFAVTGAYFLISYPLFSTPTTHLEYGGSRDSLNNDVRNDAHPYHFLNEQVAVKPDIQTYVAATQKRWGRDITLNRYEIVNYGDKDMHIIISGKADQHKKLISNGTLAFSAITGKVVAERSPLAGNTYLNTVDFLLYSLHFGNYGGYATRILYFLLGICGCVVIISGVLIWLVARDKKNIPAKKRKFNEWLVNIYLAICLSMYPVTAAVFIAVKLHPTGGMRYIYNCYFWTWLAISVLLTIRKNIFKTNRDCLLAGSIIGFLIPVINGIKTDNWIWVSYKNHYRDIMLIDIFWLLLSVATFICWRLTVLKQRKTAKTDENSLI